MQLAEGAGCKRALTCPYHGWTYGLDGQLRVIPHEHGFPRIDKREHGFVPVKAVEKHGLVFVTQDVTSSEPDDDGLPDFLGPEWRLLGTAIQELDVNWKIFVDGLLEGYHIRSTHSETFYPRQYDNVTVVDLWLAVESSSRPARPRISTWPAPRSAASLPTPMRTSRRPCRQLEPGRPFHTPLTNS